MNAEVVAALEKLSADLTAIEQAATRLRGDVKALSDTLNADLLEGEHPDSLTELIKLPPQSRGIDVSHWQGAIDWAAVKASGLAAFAFIKATEGANVIDSRFQVNWPAARAAGIPRGAYHFYRFGASPLAQANLFCSQLGQDFGELPPVVDVEEDVASVDLSKSVRVFCERVYDLIGRRCLIYTGAWWWTAKRLGGPQPWVKDYGLWIAAYIPKPIVPADWPTWAFWQFSNSGHVPGIAGNVDLNVSA